MLFNETRYLGPDSKVRQQILAATGGNEWKLPWPLPNMRASTEKEFWGWRASQGFRAEVWAGQDKVELDGKPQYANLLLYWLDVGSFMDGGFVVAVDRSYQREKVHYFAWKACEHEFACKHTGNCQRRYTCQKCGRAFDEDSSG